jgi:hypothetical protein
MSTFRTVMLSSGCTDKQCVFIDMEVGWNVPIEHVNFVVFWFTLTLHTFKVTMDKGTYNNCHRIIVNGNEILMAKI